MRQIELFEVPSPCIGICQSGPKGYCRGCYRSRDERLNWLKVDDNTKKIINDACMRRKQAYLRRQQTQTLKMKEPLPVTPTTGPQKDLF